MRLDLHLIWTALPDCLPNEAQANKDEQTTDKNGPPRSLAFRPLQEPEEEEAQTKIDRCSDGYSQEGMFEQNS